MLKATFRQIEKWPRKETRSYQRCSPFRSTFAQTMDLLERELQHLAAKNVVVQIDCDPSQIRNDGWPRSDARVRSPRIAIGFDSVHGPLIYYCDDCNKWIDNVRAIALTLEWLRGTERYGVTKRAEQYQGFKQLPGGIPVVPVQMTLETAAADIVTKGGGDTQRIIAEPAYFQHCYRRAVMNTHPDRYPHMVESFKQLQTAAELLKKHHGIA